MRKVSVAAVLAAGLGMGLLFTPSGADAHRVYQLQGTQWAIICDNGTGYSFSGSATGAGEVAGLLCGPTGTHLVSPGGGGVKADVGITRGELLRADRFVTKGANGRFSLTGAGAGGGQGNLAFKGYPPHGYPCLGCAPCPGSNPVEYCDITAIMHPGAAAAGWRVNEQGRIVRTETKADATTR